MDEPLLSMRTIPGPADPAAEDAALLRDLMMVMGRFHALLAEHRRERLSDADQHALAVAVGALLKALLR